MPQSHIFDDQHRWEQVPDEEIVQRVQSGEMGLFDILIYRYRRRLYATVLGVVRNRDDAEDVVQMACFKTYTHLHCPPSRQYERHRGSSINSGTASGSAYLRDRPGKSGSKRS